MEKMNICKLQEYATEHGGYSGGKFICFNEKGIFEFEWLDAYMGLIKIVQPEIEGFVTMDTLQELFGDDQTYTPTIGYDC